VNLVSVTANTETGTLTIVGADRTIR
jgi:hypothetical protein